MCFVVILCFLGAVLSRLDRVTSLSEGDDNKVPTVTGTDCYIKFVSIHCIYSIMLSSDWMLLFAGVY